MKITKKSVKRMDYTDLYDIAEIIREEMNERINEVID